MSDAIRTALGPLIGTQFVRDRHIDSFVSDQDGSTIVECYGPNDRDRARAIARYIAACSPNAVSDLLRQSGELLDALKMARLYVEAGKRGSPVNPLYAAEALSLIDALVERASKEVKP